MVAHHAAFDKLVDAARRDALLRPARAAAAAEAAAAYAADHHPGTFDSGPLDAVLARAARRLPKPKARRSQGVERVVHVATGFHDVGGHTRLATRWIAADAERRHVVVLTAQYGAVPDPVRAVVDATGGYVVRLDRDVGHLTRAAALREHLADADLVATHAHPSDVVPVLALAAWPARPPALLVNHADHAFWPGASVADVVADVRPAGTAITLARRGVPPEREAALPLPLDPPAALPSREAARRALGWPLDERVVLSMASVFKFACLPGPRLPELLAPVLREHGARLVVVGPPPGALEGAETVGLVPDPAAYLAAADVYVDSYPGGSVTATLDAALTGLPVVAYQPEREAPVLYSDDACVAGYADLAAFLEALDDLLAAPRRGDTAAALAHHTGAGWRAALEDCYARTLARPTGSAPIAPAGRLDDVLVALSYA